MRSTRTPNQALRALLAEAGWSGARLARVVNALGAAQGVALRYDRSSVAHWLAGSRPRPPVPSLVAEALTRQLGRHVGEADTGLVRTTSPPAPPGEQADEGDSVSRLHDLLRVIDRRGAARLGAYSLTALVTPGTPSGLASAATPLHDRRPLSAPPPGPVGQEHVASAHAMLDLFSRQEAAFGAGGVHVPLRQYLSTTLLPWLRADPPPAVRRELFNVAARLTYLCAFAHFDMNQQVAAQRLYLASVELAREVGDMAGQAIALRGLSHQARTLGHHAEALTLAEQAVGLGERYLPPRQQAFLRGQLAVALAADGDARSVRQLSLAERRLERATSDSSSVAAFHAGSLALQHAAVARKLGDRRVVLRALDASLRHRPVEERRSRALVLAELGEEHLAQGHLEQSCQAWQLFLDIYPKVRSARVDNRLRRAQAALRPHSANPAAAAVLRRVRAVRAGPGSRGAD
ncbi:hypothetical protein [Streptomyces durbertensis]|uniref:hypothetical protein n=1 Tax=Streptomyces durbertensis TaxID=2448886 RepID=UPI00188791CB|nr:hypothetical protein [Streptomyces durbertensis]